MNEKLRCELAKKKIRGMKAPTILMNENDFEVFKKEIKISDNPSYQDIPIKTTELIEKGNIIVCDKPFFFTN